MKASTATNAVIGCFDSESTALHYLLGLFLLCLLSHMPKLVMKHMSDFGWQKRVSNNRIQKDVLQLYHDKNFIDSFFPFFIDSQLRISITTVGAGPIAGESYTFICAVTFPMGEFNGTLQWVRPDSSTPINSMEGITVTRTPPYTLTINPLRQSHNGQYTCQATIGNITGSTSTMLQVGGT